MNPPNHILVVDDDPGITALLVRYLGGFGYVVHTAGDGTAMQRVLAMRRIDLIVLDLTLPGADGLTLVRELRRHSSTPIIVLTGRSNPADRVVGLEMGADDYMSKPFEPRELVARIQTVLRRVGPAPDAARSADPALADLIRFDGWQLLRSERRLTSPQGVVVALSDAEYRLLAVFLKAPRRVVSRSQLMAQSRGRSLDALERSVDQLVSRLRSKLSDDGGGSGEMIRTVRGEGYVFDAQTQPAALSA